ncbi:hypothetical protein [Lignipirellula cremea]|uniref:Uncharacterized protein n=1 Tax=Lignipirellula cremea TaxID=2528010 RepID=A0A518DLT7_9BACT|nr:hypothetical protein [Lignipirellula cremea]QDU92785.1 hypothetical protein Pla8534_05580 [Lignipirellula cremea]
MMNPEKLSGLPDHARSPGVNINGIVGIVFSVSSLLGWGILACLMVSYETNVHKPERTGDGQRDLGAGVTYHTEVAARKTGAFAINTFLVVVGGAASAMLLLVGIVTSAIGLAYPEKTLAIIGLGLGIAALLCGVLFLAWRLSIWS